MPDYSKPLSPWRVSVRMVYQPALDDAEIKYQQFSIVVPAVSEETARKAAAELIYVIGEASEWQWKSAAENAVTVTPEEDHLLVRQPDEPA